MVVGVDEGVGEGDGEGAGDGVDEGVGVTDELVVENDASLPYDVPALLDAAMR